MFPEMVDRFTSNLNSVNRLIRSVFEVKMELISLLSLLLEVTEVRNGNLKTDTRR